MNRSDRISKEHEDQLAKLPADQRKTILGEASNLLKRLRIATRLEQRGYKPTKFHVGGDGLLAWLKSQPPGSRITKVERKKD